MFNLTDAANGLFGAWRLIHFDRSGLQYFRVTPDAFWNSFWAAAIVIPGEVIGAILLAQGDEAATLHADPFHSLLVFIGTYLIAWLLFALVMAGYLEAIQRGERFVLFVVAWNWARVVRMAIILPTVAIFAMEGTSEPGWGAAIYMAAMAGTLVYAGFVARTALDVPIRTAVAVVVIEIGLSTVLWLGAQVMLG
ncbi:MAG: hypothetical protein JJ899_15265 [Alphaproteobacteria bacterium]|nr:hypothetical protein [Alphaproteobacteria bacterium]